MGSFGLPTKEDIGQVVPSTWTVEEYELLPDDGIRYEILEGELAMTPAPTTEHQRISRRLQFILYGALEQTGRAEVFNAPFDVQLDDASLVQPDLVVILEEHRDLLTERRLVGPPDVVVEILSISTARHDKTTKMRLYARFGVPSYWLVDPEQKRLLEYVLDEGSYRLSAVVEQEDSFCPRSFPGLEIPLTEVFRGPGSGRPRGSLSHER